jgi:hypothetical protein
MKRTSMMSQLASVSEGALGRLTSSDVTKSAWQAAVVLKERTERLVKGMAELDDRVASLERRVAALEKPAAKSAPRKTTARKTTSTAAKKTTAAKPRTSSSTRSTS